MFDLFKIVSSIKKTVGKKDILITLTLLILFVLTRFVNLDKFPIFSDEGIYIHWAKIAWHDATWRFISLTDGRQPLQTWATIPFLKLFPNNALFAGRLFSVVTGFFGLTGIFLLLNYLFDRKTAYIGSILYVVTPYFLFYDRLALIDSGVNAAFIWILFFSILMVRTLRLDIAIIFGLIGGLSTLAKSSIRLFLALSVFAPILEVTKHKKTLLRFFVNFLFLFSIATFLTIAVYNVQRLSPFFHFVSEKNNTFIMTLDEFKKNPFSVFFDNLIHVPIYVFWEMGFVLGVIGILGWLFLYKKDKSLWLYMGTWVILPYIIISLFTKVLYPRYIIFFGTLLTIFAAGFFSRIKNKMFLVLIAVIYIISIGYFDYTIVFDYKNIPFPSIDRGQYLEGWPAGWGMEDIVNFAREKSGEKPVVLLAEGNFGMAGDVLDVFLKKNDKIAIKGYWPLDKIQIEENIPLLKSNLVYIVFSHRDSFPQEWPIKLIKKYTKPENKSAIFLYQLVK